MKWFSLCEFFSLHFARDAFGVNHEHFHWQIHKCFDLSKRKDYSKIPALTSENGKIQQTDVRSNTDGQSESSTDSSETENCYDLVVHMKGFWSEPIIFNSACSRVSSGYWQRNWQVTRAGSEKVGENDNSVASLLVKWWKHRTLIHMKSLNTKRRQRKNKNEKSTWSRVKIRWKKKKKKKERKKERKV